MIGIALMMTPIINIILKMTMAVLVVLRMAMGVLITHHGALGLMEVNIALVRLVTGDAIIWANLVIIKLKQHAMRIVYIGYISILYKNLTKGLQVSLGAMQEPSSRLRGRPTWSRG